ncbi:MAG: terminase gpA endonuclease subunit [Bryobacteraceae bacterium]|nr:terminase gpA endonuclease subunit [Bryobacteraceae bacterium]
MSILPDSPAFAALTRAPLRAIPLTLAERTVHAEIRHLFRVTPRLTPSQWCEQHLVMPVGFTEARPGRRVDFSTDPHLREPLDNLATPGVTDTLLAAPTRGGKTFLLKMAAAYSVAGDPAPFIWVDSTIDKGRSIAKKELHPLIRGNSVLRARIPADRHHFTTQEMLFPGAALNIYGANSPAGVAGDTVRRVLCNEAGRYRAATDDEASTLQLVRHRTESYNSERAHFFSGTPQRDDGQFWLEMETGDLREWHVPCPHCHTFQSFLWARVVWSPAARREGGTGWDLEAAGASARYSCINPECPAHDPSGTRGTGWTDTQRVAAYRHPEAHWRPTQVGQPGVRSYQVPGMLGGLDTNTFRSLVIDFLKARAGPFLADRQDFWNSRMGLPWKENPSEISATKLAHLERPYDRGKLPEGFKPDVLIVSFDVQTYGLPFVVRAYAWTGESYLVDHGLVTGWDDLAQIQTDYSTLARSYVVGDIHFADRRAETLEQIWRRRALGWLACEGVEYSKDRVRVEAVNVFMGGKLQSEQIKVPRLLISTYDFKLELEQRFAGTVKNWWLYSLPLVLEESSTEREEFAAYKTQLLDERRVPRKKRRAGLPAWEWKSRAGNNHALDCEVYGLGLFWVLVREQSFKRRRPAARRSIQVQR